MSEQRERREAGALSRREILVGAGALAGAAAGGSAWASGEHDHASHAPRHPELLQALEACLSTGRRCVSHCLVTFEEGDSRLAVCARKVHEMLAICSAMTVLTASNSVYARELAKVCAQACEDCAAECRKHADDHRECRDCMEACDAVLPMLRQLTA